MRIEQIRCSAEEWTRYQTDAAYAEKIREAATEVSRGDRVIVVVQSPDGAQVFRAMPPTKTCAECGETIDPTKPGDGHRANPPCGDYTFHVNPVFLEWIRGFTVGFAQEFGRSPTGNEIIDAWVEHRFPSRDEVRGGA